MLPCTTPIRHSRPSAPRAMLSTRVQCFCRPRRMRRVPNATPSFARATANRTLQFDKRFGNEQVPHDKPETVHAFLLKRFGEYIAAHPDGVHEVNPSDRLLPERVRVLRSEEH